MRELILNKYNIGDKKWLFVRFSDQKSHEATEVTITGIEVNHLEEAHYTVTFTGSHDSWNTRYNVPEKSIYDSRELLEASDGCIS